MKPKPATVSSAGKKRIFLVEDHPIFCEGLARAVNREPDLMVCGSADSASAAFSAICSCKPDLVLVDLTLPGRSGLELIKDLRVAAPETVMLVLSMHDEALYAERALRAGARGYVMKHTDTSIVLEAIRHVLGGGIYVTPHIGERILRSFSPSSRKECTPAESLTDREFEVLRLLGRGLTTSAIAREMHLSPKTVAVHRSNLKSKLKLNTVAEVIRFALTYDRHAQQ